jgi:hypothetical protein
VLANAITPVREGANGPRPHGDARIHHRGNDPRSPAPRADACGSPVGAEPYGHALIKQLRRQLLEGSRTLLEDIVRQTTGSGVVSLHTDISVRTSERVIVFTLTENLEERFGWGKREKTRKN